MKIPQYHIFDDLKLWNEMDVGDIQQMSFLKLWLNFSNWNHVVFDVGKIFFNSGDEAIPGGNGRLYDRTEAAGATEAAAAVP